MFLEVLVKYRFQSIEIKKDQKVLIGSKPLKAKTSIGQELLQQKLKIVKEHLWEISSQQLIQMNLKKNCKRLN